MLTSTHNSRKTVHPVGRYLETNQDLGDEKHNATIYFNIIGEISCRIENGMFDYESIYRNFCQSTGQSTPLPDVLGKIRLPQASILPHPIGGDYYIDLRKNLYQMLCEFRKKTSLSIYIFLLAVLTIYGQQ